jgi:hypothetical protein
MGQTIHPSINQSINQPSRPSHLPKKVKQVVTDYKITCVLMMMMMAVMVIIRK